MGVLKANVSSQWVPISAGQPVWKMEAFNFPASKALLGAGVIDTVTPFTRLEGDQLCDIVTLNRPAGWSTASGATGTALAFKAAGLYVIDGIMTFATALSGEAHGGYMGITTRTGGAVSAGWGRGWPGFHHPVYWNSYVRYHVDGLEVPDSNVAVWFAYSGTSAVNTYTSPGWVWIKKIG